MQTVELGRTGRQVSALALGAMQMGSETPEEESRTILDRYVELITETARDLARREPDQVRRIDKHLVVAAVGGIHEVMLVRVERGEAAQLAEETDRAAQLLIDLLERRP